jgi:hypothetical protein
VLPIAYCLVRSAITPLNPDFVKKIPRSLFQSKNEEIVSGNESPKSIQELSYSANQQGSWNNNDTLLSMFILLENS